MSGYTTRSLTPQFPLEDSMQTNGLMGILLAILVILAIIWLAMQIF